MAVVRVLFGGHQAPGLVQHLVAPAIAKVPPGAVIVVQSLDDILFLGRDKNEVARVTNQVAGRLVREGHLIRAKSQPDPVESVAWMGKDIGAGARSTAITDCIAR